MKIYDYSTLKIGEEIFLTYQEINEKSDGILQKLSKATKRRSEYGNKPLNDNKDNDFKVPSKVITTRSNPAKMPPKMGSGGGNGRITFDEVGILK